MYIYGEITVLKLDLFQEIPNVQVRSCPENDVDIMYLNQYAFNTLSKIGCGVPIFGVKSILNIYLLGSDIIHISK